MCVCDVILAGIAAYVASLWMAWGAIEASTVLHLVLLANCLRSPMSFYDTTPIGRVLNRFSKDIDTIDTMIPQNVRAWMMCTFNVVATFMVISYATPLILAVAVPLFVLYFFVQV